MRVWIRAGASGGSFFGEMKQVDSALRAIGAFTVGFRWCVADAEDGPDIRACRLAGGLAHV